MLRPISTYHIWGAVEVPFLQGTMIGGVPRISSHMFGGNHMDCTRQCPYMNFKVVFEPKSRCVQHKTANKTCRTNFAEYKSTKNTLWQFNIAIEHSHLS